MELESRIKNDEQIQIGSNIRRLRKARNMKANELICAVNLLGADLNVFSLSKIEANTQHIKASQFRAIVTVLQCDPMELLKENR